MSPVGLVKLSGGWFAPGLGKSPVGRGKSPVGLGRLSPGLGSSPVGLGRAEKEEEGENDAFISGVLPGRGSGLVELLKLCLIAFNCSYCLCCSSHSLCCSASLPAFASSLAG